MRNAPECDSCLFYAVCNKKRHCVCAEYYNPDDDNDLLDEYIESERIIFRSIWNQYMEETYDE